MELDFKVARHTAGANLKAVIKNLPREIADREGRIYSELTASRDLPFRKLEKIYTLLDDVLAFVSAYIPCHKGCPACCCLMVSVSTIEADYIQNKTRARQSITIDSRNLFGTPCPFLKQEACSIYEYRPYVCRRHVVLFNDPKWCSLELCGMYKFPKLRLAGIEKSYEHLVAADGGGFLCDIRQLFS